MNVLVTGASGFIGSFLVEEAVRRGMTAWAGVRATSSRAYLRDEHIYFATLNLDKKDLLREQLREHRDRYGKWDYIIHCAGVTKCRNKAEGIRRLRLVVLSQGTLICGHPRKTACPGHFRQKPHMKREGHARKKRMALIHVRQNALGSGLIKYKR